MRVVGGGLVPWSSRMAGYVRIARHVSTTQSGPIAARAYLVAASHGGVSCRTAR